MQHDVTPSPASLTEEEMTAALEATAQLSRSELKRAATHLLTFTGLPGRADFARHTALMWEDDPDAGRVLIAEVDWDALRDDTSMPLSGSTDKLLHLALSYAKGRPVHLNAYLHSFGTATAKRVLDARWLDERSTRPVPAGGGRVT
ncbi:hypothetical protein [Streptomyces candidus]|uniref:Uncharacterized protein n=1 Tax=Streptomyces candidus TaxID=67283 RepID=A0A7X0LTZ1_9ACTN|nr:hypothetical protein [Streptomyces candidus]MBB6439546.1 hypothetical protein [Streptomyces candidus]GHH54516.1 hypothetical protein GCM10018773_57590 [Streptomyces candidus]